MRIAIFSTRRYEQPFFSTSPEAAGHQVSWFEPRLSIETAPLAHGFRAVSAFVNDDLGAPVLEALRDGGTELIALRCAGYNQVDLEAAKRLGLTIVRVPAYSPYAVAEHAIALMLCLNRKTHKAYNRVREGNFALDGLLGFDLHRKTVGVVGMGKIGQVVSQILTGFGCRLLAFDPKPSAEALTAPVRFVELDELLGASDIITLHCPLLRSTHHLVNVESIAKMKRGVMLVNTSRGGLIDTRAVIGGLKCGHIGSLGLDVYEEEEGLFFEDLTGVVIQDDVFARLLSFPNVVLTGHQGFFTAEALQAIAETTLRNVTEFESTGACSNRVQ